ncbi:hypothetical protein GF314_00110, partial [bacterium]|nr:hypothetical protein [bacterium]
MIPSVDRQRHGGRAAALTLALVLIVVADAPAADAATGGPGGVLRAALADLDPGLVTTGRLLDRTVPVSDPLVFDGRPDAPPVPAARWRDLLGVLRDASLESPSWPADREVRERTRGLAGRGMVPLAVLDLACERLRPDALTSGALVRDGGRLVAAAAADRDDLVTRHRITAAAVLDPVLHRGAATRFLLPRDLLITDEPVTVALDPGDGRGWRDVRPGRPLTVRYEATGLHEVRVRLTTASGDVRRSRSEVDVAALDVPDPTATWPLTASLAYDGQTASGVAYVYLAEGHAEVTDPVVVVEGFDLNDDLDWPELYT